jgi:DNA-binding NarL/FixJ family response regulator
MENIKIVIADDMEAHRRRLERIIRTQPDFELLDSLDSGAGTVLSVRERQPDIILTDIEMESKFAGIEASKAIHEQFPEVKIIVLTVHEDDNIVFAAFQNGIVDYLIKSATPDEIIAGVRAAYLDDSPIRPIIARKLRSELVRVKNNEAALMALLNTISSLTPSQLDILKLLCQHKSRQQIAELRSVEVETIKKQINGILKKFNMSRTSEVVGRLNELNLFEVARHL